jgi:hypothetical protein
MWFIPISGSGSARRKRLRKEGRIFPYQIDANLMRKVAKNAVLWIVSQLTAEWE